MITGMVVRDATEFAALEPEWWDLWKGSPQATPFQSPAWLLPWWRHFSPGELFVLVARQGGRLVGLAPSYIENGALGRRILPVGISLSDHLDILLDPDCADQAATALAGLAAEHAGEWDVWELEELEDGAAAFRLPALAGWRDERSIQTACPMLLVADSKGTSWLPQRKRGQISLARNRLARRGVAAIEMASAETLPEFLKDLFRLHEARWTDRGKPGLLAFKGVKYFHRDAASRLLGAGLLRLARLRLDHKTIATCHALRHRDRLSIYLTGFDPAWTFESPGVLVMAHLIEEAVRDGARVIDFLRGQEPYKYTWGAVDRWNQRRSLRQAREAVFAA